MPITQDNLEITHTDAATLAALNSCPLDGIQVEWHTGTTNYEDVQERTDDLIVLARADLQICYHFGDHSTGLADADEPYVVYFEVFPAEDGDFIPEQDLHR